MIALCAILAALAPLAATAARSAQPKTVPVAWQVTLLNDLYDGTISNIYPIHCYGEAINHLPLGRPDLRQREGRHHRGQAGCAAVGKLPPQGHAVVVVTSTSKGGLTGFLDRLVPGNPNSFPTPLLILGLLAIVLILAGLGGMLWQRSHPRDDDESDDDGPPQLGPGDDGPPQLGPGDTDVTPPQLGP